jgi:hypothetical protein
MRDLNSIRKIVIETLARQFAHVPVLDVQVHEDVDSDGDEVLRIDVIFEGSLQGLDAHKLLGVGRYLRPALEAIDESALPLLSFISKADMPRSRRAPA